MHCPRRPRLTSVSPQRIVGYTTGYACQLSPCEAAGASDPRRRDVKYGVSVLW